MSNRWHMHRMGFINFWLYDEETFLFADGRLLLRGQNGSGKSVTTQSLIPFILDGDRSPGRLDPFGSNSRKMEYYLLGDGEKEEATGYLFLEFKRENRQQYRTIGIGQKAQRGKPMAFWGFLLLDGRRVGYEIKLCRDVGGRKIPCTKRELRQKLEGINFFTETQREYMELVNRYLFGFPCVEQYQQMIRLLVKVRAPKLSKELSPSKVYEVLEESLWPLSNEDLRPMAETMENMDDIQDRLMSLKRAFEDLTALRKEYLRYNLYMLGKKAKAYEEAKEKACQAAGLLEQKERELKEKKENQRAKERKSRKLEEKIQLLEREKSTFYLDEVEASIDRLNGIREQKKQEEKERDRLLEQIEWGKKRQLSLSREFQFSRLKKEEYRSNAERLFRDLEQRNGIIEIPCHEKLKESGPTGGESAKVQEVYRELTELKCQVEGVQQVLGESRGAQKKWSEQEERYQKILAGVQEAQKSWREADRQVEACREWLAERLLTAAEDNQELEIGKKDLKKILGKIEQYQGPGDYEDIRSVLRAIWWKKKEVLEREQRSLKEQQIEGRIKIQGLKEERDRRVSDRQEQAREFLEKKGISCLFFYETVEFAENLDSETRKRVEGQLAASGLLDALVIAEEDYKRAVRELRGIAVVLLNPGGFKEESSLKEERFPYLIPADVGSQTLRQAVGRLLSCLSRQKVKLDEKGFDGRLVLYDNGYFEQGILEGYGTWEKARYIGEKTREEEKQKILRERKCELAEAEKELENWDARLKYVEQRLFRLDEEYKAVPTFAELEKAIGRAQVRREALEWWEAEAQPQERAAAQAKRIYDECEKVATKLCRLLPYGRKLEDYIRVKEEISLYIAQLGEWERAKLRQEMEENRCFHVQELLEREEQEIRKNSDCLRRSECILQELDVLALGMEEHLKKTGAREKVRRLKQIKEELFDQEEQRQDTLISLAVLESEGAALEKEKGQLWLEAKEWAETEKREKECFEAELALGLVKEMDEVPKCERIQKAVQWMRSADENRSAAEMLAALMKSFHEHLGTLCGYGICMEESSQRCVDGFWGKRQVLMATWKGKKVSLEVFYRLLKETVESTELLIRQRDRELFEEILSDSLGRKLSRRIQESQRWVRAMSSLMREMDTSMGLTFSLEWKPRPAEGAYELEVQQLNELLLKEKGRLMAEDMEKITRHFRAKIYAEKQKLQDSGQVVNYMDLIRGALDYRQWFEFHMYYYRGQERRKELTNSAFHRFSGGEKAMAMYVPLFAAVNAQYQKAQNVDHPRILALDEAFAGVDDKNIESIFQLMQKMGFDYIMNSQILWGCYRSVKNLNISELYRPGNSGTVTVISYHWNGCERLLEEQ